MKFKIIEKERIPILIEELIKEYEVFMPVKEKKIVSFQRITLEKQVNLDFWNTKKPPKEIFIPQTETLFTYKSNKKDIEIFEPPIEKKKRVLFGVRPCDARSFVLLDKVWIAGEKKDINYLKKRKNTIILGLACRQPRSTCFCTSLGGSPSGKEGMDLLLQDLNERYLIEVVTKKGKELAKKFLWWKDAETADIEMAKKLASKAKSTIKSEVSVNNVIKKLQSMFDSPLWNQIHQKCLGCGICTFLCPTCSCFDILEEERKRVRIWDTCQFSCFTCQGSGHNPRPSGKERMRQRIMHKFNYYVRNYGESFCVGCGRCVHECPVNLDIRETLEVISTKPRGETNE